MQRTGSWAIFGTLGEHQVMKCSKPYKWMQKKRQCGELRGKLKFPYLTSQGSVHIPGIIAGEGLTAGTR
jgi:hypothetical protein